MISNSFKNFVTLKISQINRTNTICEKLYTNFNVLKWLSTLQTQLEKKNMIKQINIMRIFSFNYGTISCLNRNLLIEFQINGLILDFRQIILLQILEVQDFQVYGIQLSSVVKKSVKVCSNGQSTKKQLTFFVQLVYS